MKVPLLDLKAQYATMKDEMLKVVAEVMESQYFINGPAVAELEKKVAAYSGCKAAVGVSSGSDALLCALMAMNIGVGDEIITTPYTFFATAGAIARLGAKPVFVDIEADTFNIDPNLIEKAITKKTKAIIPVHLFGQMAEMGPIMEIANRHNLFVLEDAAQSIGSRYKDKIAGSIGLMGCLSFFPSKNLGGLGDGGMITTNDETLAHKLSVFRNHGMEPKYYYKFVGGNFRLDTLQAAGLLVKLKYLDQWSDGRRRNAAMYDKLLAGVPSLRTPVIRPYNHTIYNQYVICVSRRDELLAHMKKHDIGVEVYYPLSLHEQECFKSLGYKKGDFPNSEKTAAESLALPIYPELTTEQIEYVAATIRHFYSA